MGDSDTSTSKAEMPIYRKLDPTQFEIRLVHLLPGSGMDPIDCHLNTVNWSNAICYEALSYEWGDPTSQKQITLQGQSFPIRSNLWLALRRLRSQNKIKIIWIDAICINQNDVLERNHQVGLMKQIYRVWLGEEDDDTPLGFDVLKFIDENADTFSMTPSPGSARSLPTCLHIKDREESVPPGSHLRAFTKILHRPYWRRIWIVQEYVLARTVVVHCGSFSAVEPPEHMLTANDSMFRNTPAGKIIQRYHSHKNQAGYSRPFATVLQDFQQSKSLDPRDKVFALLGLASDINVEVNYEKSPEDVRKDVLRAYAHQCQPEAMARSWSLIYKIQGWLKYEGHEIPEIAGLTKTYLEEVEIEYPFPFSKDWDEFAMFFRNSEHAGSPNHQSTTVIP